MGRWRYSNRDVVEECRCVDIHFLKKYGFLKRCISGSIIWADSSEGKNSIGVQSSLNEEPASITFTYTVTKHSGEKEDMNYKTELVKTPCNYGWYRFWFKCGGIVNGIHCGRRISKLYKAPIGKYFLCRHCYNLTYRLRKVSRKWTYSSDKLDNKLNKINKKLERKGIHSKTYKKLSWKKQCLTWDLNNARIREYSGLLGKMRRLNGKLDGMRRY